jgi:hypothetical protein
LLQQCKAQKEEMLRTNQLKTENCGPSYSIYLSPYVFHNESVPGFYFDKLGTLTAASGTSFQEEEQQGQLSSKNSRRLTAGAGRCGTGSCKSRTGACCKLVWRSWRQICPKYC